MQATIFQRTESSRAQKREESHDRDVANLLHNSRPGDFVCFPVDGAGATRDDDGGAATATRSAAAGSCQSSPQAPAEFPCDGSTGRALRDDGDGSDVQVSALQTVEEKLTLWLYCLLAVVPGVQYTL